MAESLHCSTQFPFFLSLILALSHVSPVAVSVPSEIQVRGKRGFSLLLCPHLVSSPRLLFAQWKLQSKCPVVHC